MATGDILSLLRFEVVQIMLRVSVQAGSPGPSSGPMKPAFPPERPCSKAQLIGDVYARA